MAAEVLEKRRIEIDKFYEQVVAVHEKKKDRQQFIEKLNVEFIRDFHR